MAGLALRANLGAGGNYTPLSPASASPASSASSLSQLAYGINGSGEPTKSTAGYGSVAVGIIAMAAMVYLWWSLPR